METGQRETAGSSGAAQVDEYLAEQSEPQRTTLATLRETIRSVLPQGQECIRYGSPAFAIDGKGVAGYAAFTNHCSYLPMSGSVLEAAGAAVETYKVSKGALQFAVDEPLPVGVVRRLIELRLDEISAAGSGST